MCCPHLLYLNKSAIASVIISAVYWSRPWIRSGRIQAKSWCEISYLLGVLFADHHISLCELPGKLYPPPVCLCQLSFVDISSIVSCFSICSEINKRTGRQLCVTAAAAPLYNDRKHFNGSWEHSPALLCREELYSARYYRLARSWYVITEAACIKPSAQASGIFTVLDVSVLCDFGDREQHCASLCRKERLRLSWL